MRQWLEQCDPKHDRRPAQLRITSYQSDDGTLPTRLLVVGNEGDELDQAIPAGTSPYRTHGGPSPHFCTFLRNLPDHKRGIPLQSLPETFRGAVLVTRALEIPYLWIDSICVVRGSDGDFQEEAKRIELVFNSFYAAIAASSSANQMAGFLKPRHELEYVTLRRSPNEAPFYVCELIDDFNAHVLKSNLSSRDWVLQEHALARRNNFLHESPDLLGVRRGCQMRKRNTHEQVSVDPPPVVFPLSIHKAQHGHVNADHNT
jgi:hypothetical protein